MSEERFQQTAELILGEIGRVLAQVEPGQVREFEEAVLSAPAIFVTGKGRSGLAARCFALRAMHLGLPVHVVGETTAPALRPGDLLVAISGSGETVSTCALAGSAAGQGAQVAVVTATPGSTLASRADLLLLVPAMAGESGGKASAQFGGSLFEQSALLVLDAIALRLQRRLQQSDEQMQARHATVE